MGTYVAGGMVSPVGIEPTTNWLKASCSTTELRAHAVTWVVNIRSGPAAVNRGGKRVRAAAYSRSANVRMERFPYWKPAKIGDTRSPSDAAPRRTRSGSKCSGVGTASDAFGARVRE